MNVQKSFIYVFFLLILGIGNSVAQTPPSSLPEFTFYRLDGTRFTKSNLSKGTKSVLVFFDVTCEHCQREAENLGKNYPEFKGVSFYMISLDQPPAINQFMNTYGKKLNGKKNVTLLQDKDKKFIPTFFPLRYPAIYVYSTQGKLIQSFSGETAVDQIIKATK